jgi:hypothetical protein
MERIEAYAGPFLKIESKISGARWISVRDLRTRCATLGLIPALVRDISGTSDPH